MGGKAWTPEEDAVLRDVSEKGVTLKSQMHRLPGRNWNAAKCRAEKQGIKLSLRTSWSEAERAILREIWASNVSIKVGMKRLPHRNYDAARAEAQRLGIRGGRGTTGRTGYAYVKPAIVAALEKESPLRADEIATIIGATVRQVSKVLRRDHAETFRIDGWMRKSTFGDPAARWALGTGPDAPRPARKAPEVSNRESALRARVRTGQFNPFSTLMLQVAA